MNKRWILQILILIGSIGVSAQGKVVANINNLKSDKGVCKACLFNNAASFTGSGGNPYQCITIEVKNKAANGIFTNVKPDSYALFVFHDENNNNKLDQNFLGMPKEGYGASRNKLPFAAAPKFDENKFDVLASNVVSLNIKIRNLF